MPELIEQLKEWVGQSPYTISATVLGCSIVLSYMVAFVIERTLGRLAGKTKTDVDDKIIAAIRVPIIVSTILFGLVLCADVLPLPSNVFRITVSALKTIAIAVWARAALHSSTLVLQALSRRNKRRKSGLVNARTVPVFDMLAKVVLVGTTIYFVFLAWHVDVTAWLASAGIIGVAVGFAAQDTLGNLFSGFFIVADAPYKVGDVIVLEDGLRGRVTSIGFRSTRVLTRNNIEITSPNSVIAGAQIVNEGGGPSVRTRVGVTVDAAYGADLERVHEVLLSAARGVDHLSENEEPVVRFTAFGASGLTHILYVWIDDSEQRELVEHLLHTSIYEKFNEAGLEIPFSKHDIYLKEAPDFRLAG